MVYSLQALRFWIRQLNRGHQRTAFRLDPDTQDFILQVSLEHSRIWEDYKKSYRPESNMVSPESLGLVPEMLREEDFPPGVYPYVPRDKFDTDKVRWLIQSEHNKNEVVLKELLVCVQDVNWPIAHEALPYLDQLSTELVAPLKWALRAAYENADDWWAYNLITCLLKNAETSLVKGLTEELNDWCSTESETATEALLVIIPETEDKEMLLSRMENLKNGLRILADDLQERINQLVQK